jgi:hypothetical protein
VDDPADVICNLLDSLFVRELIGFSLREDRETSKSVAILITSLNLHRGYQTCATNTILVGKTINIHKWQITEI